MIVTKAALKDTAYLLEQVEEWYARAANYSLTDEADQAVYQAVRAMEDAHAALRDCYNDQRGQVAA